MKGRHWGIFLKRTVKRKTGVMKKYFMYINSFMKLSDYNIRYNIRNKK